MGSRDGAVVRAFASLICGLSLLLVLVVAKRPCPPSTKTNTQSKFNLEIVGEELPHGCAAALSCIILFYLFIYLFHIIL